MQTFVLAAFVAAAAVAPSAPPAHAEHGPRGLLCGFASVADPGTEGGDVQTGEIDGGPLLVTGDGTLTCSVQVGHELCDGPDAASVSAGGDTAVHLPPTVFSYVAPSDVPVYVCTAVTDATGSYHWDERTGDWVSGASAAHGVLATSADPDAPSPGLWPPPDSTLCPVLATLLPPQGDIPGVWDCPPYEA